MSISMTRRPGALKYSSRPSNPMTFTQSVLWSRMPVAEAVLKGLFADRLQRVLIERNADAGLQSVVDRQLPYDHM